jgi:ATP-dependent RNA circularization protein (DNA/RNA ligase family)
MQRAKKSLAGVESFDAKTVDAQQTLGGFQDGGVVIDDGDERWRMGYKGIPRS